MAREIKVKVGRELSEAELEALDRASATALHPLPPRAEAQGQEPVYEVVQCSGCGAIGYAWVDDETETAIYCAFCRRYIYA